MLYDEDENVQLNAAHALGELDSVRAVDLLLKKVRTGRWRKIFSYLGPMLAPKRRQK